MLLTSLEWTLRPAVDSDGAWIAELRARVMRPDLERLGRWDATRVRSRFLDAFEPGDAVVIQVDAKDVGHIACRAEPDALWIEHFYLDPSLQGRGMGSEVLRETMARNEDGRPFRIRQRGSHRRIPHRQEVEML